MCKGETAWTTLSATIMWFLPSSAGGLSDKSQRTVLNDTLVGNALAFSRNAGKKDDETSVAQYSRRVWLERAIKSGTSWTVVPPVPVPTSATRKESIAASSPNAC